MTRILGIPGLLGALMLALAAGCDSFEAAHEDGARRTWTGVEGESSGSADERAESEFGGATTPAAALPLTDPDIPPRMVVKNAYLAVETGDPAAAFDHANAIATAAGGLVLSSQRDEDGSTYTIEMKVPVDSFERVVADLLTLGDVTMNQITAADVTEEYYDLTARLDNARSFRARYTALLERAQNVSEVLAIEHELERIQEIIERLEGHLAYLRDHAAESRISLTISEPMTPGPILLLFEGIGWVLGKLFVID